MPRSGSDSDPSAESAPADPEEARQQVTTALLRLEEAVDLTGRAADDLLADVYGQLRRLAASYLRRERSDHTLQPTARVVELRVFGGLSMSDVARHLDVSKRALPHRH